MGVRLHVVSVHLRRVRGARVRATQSGSHRLLLTANPSSHVPPPPPPPPQHRAAFRWLEELRAAQRKSVIWFSVSAAAPASALQGGGSVGQTAAQTRRQQGKGTFLKCIPFNQMTFDSPLGCLMPPPFYAGWWRTSAATCDNILDLNPSQPPAAMHLPLSLPDPPNTAGTLLT